jgi:hypothetical protein
MVKQVATDMAMNVSFNVCEIAAENVEGSTIILQVDSFLHETLFLPRSRSPGEMGRWKFRFKACIKPGPAPTGIELDW